MTRPVGDSRSSSGKIWASQVRGVTFSTSLNRLDTVSSGPKRRKFFAPRFRRMTSARKSPSTLVDSPVASAGRRDLHREVAVVGQLAGR